MTEKDQNESFESMYGDKLRCRLIMVDKQTAAMQIWEELRKNPGGFEKVAQERSMDQGSRSLGGLLAEPITRHAYPKHVSEAAFRQLVDGDPGDKDPTHKPQDGAISGPIQVAEATWVVLKGEGVIPAQKIDRNNEMVRKSTYELIYEVKLKEAMNDYFVDLMKRASIDNKLTGHVKLANEELHPDSQSDRDVQLDEQPRGRSQADRPGRPASRPRPPSPTSSRPASRPMWSSRSSPFRSLPSSARRGRATPDAPAVLCRVRIDRGADE